MALTDHLFRHEAGRMVAVLTRLFGVHNLALAEDVVQDAFCRALEVWAFRGVPENPSAWLMVAVAGLCCLPILIWNAQHDWVTFRHVSGQAGLAEQAGVRWLHSFLSADKRKTYCLYEAKSGDDIREAARRAGLPADVVIELSDELRPEVLLAS